MQLIYLSESLINSNSANSIQVMKMCDAFQKSGYNVTLFAVENNLLNEPIKYYNCNNSFKIILLKKPKIRFIGSIVYALRISVKFKKILDEKHLIYSRSALATFFLLRKSHHHIFEAHSLPTNKYRSYIEGKILKSPNLLHLVTISSSLANDYKKKYSLSKTRIVVAHDGAEIVNFKSETTREKRNSFGYVGSLYPGRGIEIIIQLAEVFSKYDFHIVGGSPKEIEFWKNSSSIPSNLIFHGYQPYSKLKEFYDLFDIALAPYQKKVSVYGGKGDTSRWMSPLKIFEYMANRKLIVVSSIHVLKEVLVNERNAILCNPENINDWKKKVKLILSEPLLKDKIVDTAYNDFIKNYTWDNRVNIVMKGEMYK